MLAQVDAYGRRNTLFDSTGIFCTQKTGYKYLNPSRGGRFVPVENERNFSLYSFGKDFR